MCLKISVPKDWPFLQENDQELASALPTVVALNSGQWAYNDIRPYVVEVTSPIRLSAVPAVD